MRQILPSPQSFLSLEIKVLLLSWTRFEAGDRDMASYCSNYYIGEKSEILDIFFPVTGDY